MNLMNESVGLEGKNAYQRNDFSFRRRNVFTGSDLRWILVFSLPAKIFQNDSFNVYSDVILLFRWMNEHMVRSCDER